MKHKNRRCANGTLVNIVHPEARLDIQIVGSKRVIRKVCEAVFVGSQNTHAIDCPN
jgi:hypothetical protein